MLKTLRKDNDELAYLNKAVKVEFQYHNTKKYNEFLKLNKDYQDGIKLKTLRNKVEFQYHNKKKYEFLKLNKDYQVGITRRSPKRHGQVLNILKAKVRKLHQEHTSLILETTGKQVKMVQENCELPWDVLDIISKTLDFDDHFQFAGVCKNWRDFHKIYSRNFLASQEPLLLQISCYPTGSFSFISIPDQKVYFSKMGKYFFQSACYVTVSSGYFIMAGYNDNSFMLMNPFTRIKKVVNTPTSKVKASFVTRRALLAFGKCSEEFVLVILCNYCLHVYQSRNLGWVAYSRKEDPEKILDFVVLHNIIYVVTDNGNIGVLSLNSASIKFLKLKSTPGTFCFYTRLVNCDGQLLVVDATSCKLSIVYKIDFSTMNYVKLETLGDIALFYVSYRSCYALSNPSRWGYESNSVYIINSPSTRCSVYSFGDKKLQKHITLSTPDGTSSFKSDWCFRHQHFEVDYSLVE